MLKNFDSPSSLISSGQNIVLRTLHSLLRTLQVLTPIDRFEETESLQNVLKCNLYLILSTLNNN